jgi:outer membrane protein
VPAPHPTWIGRLALATLLLAALPAPPATAQEPATGAIRVRVPEPPRRGPLRFELYDQAVTFGRISDPARTWTFPPDGRAEFELTGIEPGVYALAAHHDEDGDGHIAKNFIGIPVEPIALSRGYRPKGPPVYARASFLVVAGETVEFEMQPELVLGERGLFSVGLGAVGRGNPYAGGSGAVVQPIPAITFNGERLQWFGPRLSYGLVGDDRLRLAGTANYRLRTYEEEDATVLEGLGDRKDTLMLGLAAIGELPFGVNASLGYEHDALGRIGGGAARAELQRSFQWGLTRLTPKLGLGWQSAELANHDYGVPTAAAAPGRPAHEVGDYLSLEVGVGAFIELSRNWRLVADLAVEFLPGEVTDSPLVDDGQVLKGFFALTYVF